MVVVVVVVVVVLVVVVVVAVAAIVIVLVIVIVIVKEIVIEIVIVTVTVAVIVAAGGGVLEVNGSAFLHQSLHDDLAVNSTKTVTLELSQIRPQTAIGSIYFSVKHTLWLISKLPKLTKNMLLITPGVS